MVFRLRPHARVSHQSTYGVYLIIMGLYADDALVYKTIHSVLDVEALQQTRFKLVCYLSGHIKMANDI